MSIREWLKSHENEFKTKDELIRKCARELKVKPDSVRIAYAREYGTTKKEAALDDSDIISSNTFLSDIDIVSQVQQYLKQVVKDNYIDNDKLRKKFNVSIPRWNELLALPIFEDNIFIYKSDTTGSRKVVWSSKRGVEEAKKSISLSRYE